MNLFYSNEAGANPFDDPLVIDLSDDGGSSWTNVLNTFNPIAAWTPQQFGLSGLTANNQFRIRVTASDLGVGGSVVEGGVDDVSVFLNGAGCSVCSGVAPKVDSIMVIRAGDDIVLDWSADPIAATSYNIYLLSGAGLTESVRAGSSFTKGFIHAGAALLAGDNLTYRVTAVDFCGRESILQ
jgi:hypothetical protein